MDHDARAREIVTGWWRGNAAYDGLIAPIAAALREAAAEAQAQADSECQHVVANLAGACPYAEDREVEIWRGAVEAAFKRLKALRPKMNEAMAAIRARSGEGNAFAENPAIEGVGGPLTATEHYTKTVYDAYNKACEARMTSEELRGANLTGADLAYANLRHANLYGANLAGANLRRADLPDANLRHAILYGANLAGANLTSADLTGAHLTGADLHGAHLANTVLDPARAPSGAGPEFEDDDEPGHVRCWRTDRSLCVGDTRYTPGETYTADVFSTCPDTSCHPGIYIWPTQKQAYAWLRDYDYDMYAAGIVRCRARREDIHRGGDKWRAKQIQVVAVENEEAAR